MHASPLCISLVKAAEGLFLKAYPDPGTGGIPWTIGYGHTGPDVHPGVVITAAQAEALLASDLEHFAQGVTRLMPTGLTQNQFDALVSFSFNVGLANLQTSTLLRKLKAGDIEGAGAEFPRWNRAAGKILPGLIKRRLAEQRAFLHSDYTYPPRG